MVSYVWPIALVVFSNTLYQICAKEVPGGVNAFGRLSCWAWLLWDWKPAGFTPIRRAGP